MSDVSSGLTGWRVNAIMGGREESAIQRLWLEVGFVGWDIGIKFIFLPDHSESYRGSFEKRPFVPLFSSSTSQRLMQDKLHALHYE